MDVKIIFHFFVSSYTSTTDPWYKVDVRGQLEYPYYILIQVTNETDIYLLLESLLLCIEYLVKCGSFWDITSLTVCWDFWPSVDEQLEGVLFKFCCQSKIIQRLEKPETYDLFIVDYGLYALDLHTTARNVVICSYTVTKTSEICMT